MNVYETIALCADKRNELHKIKSTIASLSNPFHPIHKFNIDVPALIKRKAQLESELLTLYGQQQELEVDLANQEVKVDINRSQLHVLICALEQYSEDNDDEGTYWSEQEQTIHTQLLTHLKGL